METIFVNQANLPRLAERIPCPDYDRSSLTAGVVHVGVGGFHRAHQAYYLHRLLAEGGAREWGICGIGLRGADRKIHDVLTEQDGLYTLIVKHPDGKVDSQIIGSVIDFLLGAEDPEPVIAKMAAPATRIVSLTITEGGYNFNPATGAFDFDHPDIRHELDHPDQPKTIYGFLTAALRRRHAAGLPAFTVMSCDNLQHNGDIIREMLLAFARRQDPELATWIDGAVSFPNTMVDRITPVTTPEDITYLQETHGIADGWPVTCEPFIQWIVEDKFANGRPALEQAGVQIVPDVKPYEKMKLRLLNAGHSVLGILGALHGYATINACMEDETFTTYLRAFLDEEVTPVLDAIPGIDVEEYKDTLEARFANPNIRDKVSRICSESSAKLPKFLIPTLVDNLARGGSIRYATLVLAAWCYYSDRRVDQDGQPLDIIDAMEQTLHESARRTTTDPVSFLRQQDLFGDLLHNERFVWEYTAQVNELYAGAEIKQRMRRLLDMGSR
ncbi:mannitol dehydrogenase family protein [Lewinella sp. JB7]|uniref:mannitol dehydrogenase family protein n=1 Tax=Lewinella sp. JB7 TaxID=2962887 RepID=UPI0020C9DAE1|nr:mannitol dehydrogenase family protein [Lewinella sp. JB7]MCP9237350.1 mannitol dehydrogenase family protein [Lewinella sp. JB7]